MIERVNQEEDNLEKEALVKDSFRVVARSDSRGDHLSDYELIDDSLRIVKTVINNWFEGIPTKNQIDNGIVISDPWGSRILSEEKTYDYWTDDQGKKYVEITVRKVKNDKWVVTSHKKMRRK